MIPSPTIQVAGSGVVTADNLNTFVQAVGSAAQLRTLVGLNNMVVYLEGLTTAGDGGQGEFLWVSASTATDDGVNTIKPPAATGNGAWIRQFDYNQSVPLWGGANIVAPSDGVSNATGAILAAAASGVALFLPKGVYLLTGDVTFTTPITFAYGAMFLATTPVTLSFKGGVFAGLWRIFNLSGGAVATFDPTTTTVGWSEWWGAQPNNLSITTFDSAPAINAAFQALIVTQFQASTYYHQSKIILNVTNHCAHGVPGWRFNSDSKPTTRFFFVGDRNNDQVLIGLVAAPVPYNDLNQFVDGVYFQDITCERQLAPNAPATGLGGPSSVRLQWTYDCNVVRNFFKGSSNGVYVYTSNSAYIHDNVCTSLFTSPVNPGNDYFIGFNVDQSGNIGTVTGTASIYIYRNIAVVGPAAAGSWFVVTQQGCTDLFIRFNESVATNGIWLQFNPTSVNSGEDCHITDNVMDGCPTHGIWINNVVGTSLRQVITIANNYMTCSNGVNIQMDYIAGLVSISNNQLGGGTAFNCNNSSGFNLIGNMCSGSTQAETFTNCSNFYANNLIDNHNGSTNVPIVLVGCSSGVVSPTLYGNNTSVKFPFGVSVDATCSRLEIQCTRVNADYIASGAINKIRYNGAAWGGGAAFGTNCIATGLLSA